MFLFNSAGRLWHRFLNALMIAISLWRLLHTTQLFALGLLPLSLESTNTSNLTEHRSFLRQNFYCQVLDCVLFVGIAFAGLSFFFNRRRLTREVSSPKGAESALTGILNYGGGPLAASFILVVGILLCQHL